MKEQQRQQLINFALGQIYKVLEAIPAKELDEAIDQYEHVIGGEVLYAHFVDRPFEYFPRITKKLEAVKMLRELKRRLE